MSDAIQPLVLIWRFMTLVFSDREPVTDPGPGWFGF